MNSEDQNLLFRDTENSVSLFKKSRRTHFDSSKPDSVLKRRSNCKYDVRILKSKGVILVLVWSFLVFSYQGLVLGTLVEFFPGVKQHPWRHVVITVFLQYCLPYLLYPFAGWIADAKIGRYKVIRGSLWLMWIGALLFLGEEIISYSLKDIVLQTSHPRITAKNVDSFLVFITVLIYILNAIGIAGFQANLIPFGVDQMEDGSSDQYSAFIHWYYWSRNGGFGLIIQLIIQSFKGYCMVEETSTLYELTDRFNLYILLFQVGSVTLAVCLDLLFSSVLNKDPKVHNPLRKVWKVSKFIVKNDRLVGYRKAITYTYDDPIRRSDYAKKAYGGPFDSDYVEDVKTFWKMLVFIFMLGLGGVFLNNAFYYTIKLSVDHLKSPPPSSLSECTTRHAISDLVYPMAFTLFIPIYEFLVHPFFRKYVPRMMVKITIGMLLMLLSVIGMLLVDAVGHSIKGVSEHSVCMMFHINHDSSDELELPVSMGYTIPLTVLLALGEMLTFISALEFLIAQSPFGMRGLLIGIFYAMNSIFNGLIGILLVIISLSFQDSVQKMKGLSCGSWYYLTSAIVGLVGIVVFFIGAVWYKKRQRGGHRTLVNHQTIIESYYETSAEMHP